MERGVGTRTVPRILSDWLSVWLVEFEVAWLERCETSELRSLAGGQCTSSEVGGPRTMGSKEVALAWCVRN